jgi:hypothetical protein
MGKIVLVSRMNQKATHLWHLPFPFIAYAKSINGMYAYPKQVLFIYLFIINILKERNYCLLTFHIWPGKHTIISMG